MNITMLSSSYPRFQGDAVATFLEPIATGVAGLGHGVDLVAPWTPQWTRGDMDGGVRFHLYRYAPLPSLNTFGYATSLQADVRLRLSAVAVAPVALLACWHQLRRVVRRTRPALVHAHWVIPSGAVAAAAGSRPLVISLHGSDVYVAERHRAVGLAARFAFRRAAWVTACSADLRDRAVALGADPSRITVIPYGVDTQRFAPPSDPAVRSAMRARIGVSDAAPMVLAVGRLVEKKGFADLVDAAARLARSYPSLRVVIAGGGDLEQPLRDRAAAAGVTEQVMLLGVTPHGDIPGLLAAADVAVAPSIRDDAGNVDGLPNTVLEMLSSATPLVTTRAGGIGAVVEDEVTGRLVRERNPVELAAAIAALLEDPARARAMAGRARDTVVREHSWKRTIDSLAEVYREALG